MALQAVPRRRSQRIPLMTRERLQHLVNETGLPLQSVAKKLGYRSENSLRQCLAEPPKATLPPDKAVRLEKYAQFRQRWLRAEQAWDQKNPLPNAD